MATHPRGIRGGWNLGQEGGAELEQGVGGPGRMAACRVTVGWGWGVQLLGLLDGEEVGMDLELRLERSGGGEGRRPGRGEGEVGSQSGQKPGRGRETSCDS